MKLKIKIAGVFMIFAGFTLINSQTNKSNNDLNLKLLIKAAFADSESGGELSCICVDCPGDESGCWSHDGSSSCNGSSGYSGSWQCEGAGSIEQHVIDCNGPC